MRIFKALAVLCGCVLLVRPGYAAPVSFPDHNFSIEIPSTWMRITTKPPEALVAMQNTDGSKTLVITATKLPENERPRGPTDFGAALNFRAGLKDTLIAQGWRFDAERAVASRGLSFVRLIGHKASNNHTMVAYTIVFADEAYAVMFVLFPDVKLNDTEVQSIFRSFRLSSR